MTNSMPGTTRVAFAELMIGGFAFLTTIYIVLNLNGINWDKTTFSTSIKPGEAHT